MGNDKTNMFVAIALSLVVLLGWHYFVTGPASERQRQAAQSQTAQQPGAPQTADGIPAPSPREGSPHAPVPGTVPGTAAQGPVSREDALARSARVRLDTPALYGSIALKGARIDDVSLKNYHETVSDESPRIVLLSPTGSANPYYAEFGWVGANAGPLPNGDTVWKADGDLLAPGKPLTLSWDNGQGLVFKRMIAVDDKFMFTVRDEVENTSANPVTLFPYSLVSRWGKPHTQGYYVLHEGLIGVLGNDGLQEYTYDKVAKEPAYGGPGTLGKAWTNVTGGWGRHHRQVLGRRRDPGAGQALHRRLHRAHRRRHQGLPDLRARRRGHGRAERLLGHHPAPVRRRQGGEPDQCLRARARHQAVRPDDRLGLVLVPDQADVPGAGLLLPSRRQFRRLDPARDADPEDLLPADRQPLIRLHGQDEGRAAGDDLHPGALQGRPDEAATGDDGAVQEGEDQSGGRLLAGADPDPGLLRAVQGPVHHHRDAARALLRLDSGPRRARSDQHREPVRPAALRRAPTSSIWACGRSSWASRCSCR
jgi:YidC/Oxa1 family membrane protein insertase